MGGANTGGAVGKIWEERERQRKGLPPSTSAAGKSKKAGGGEKKQVLSAGQTTLSFAKVSAPKSKTEDSDPRKKPAPKEATMAVRGKPRKTRDGYETEDSACEDDVVVVDEKDESEEEDKFVPSASYKKRRIAVASDEEDEG